MIGFFASFPVMVMLIISLVGAIQFATITQRMEHVAYTCCRAAASSSSMTSARKRAQDAAAQLSVSTMASLNITDVVPDISYAEVCCTKISRNGTSTLEYLTEKDMEKYKGKEKENEYWLKGNYIKCSITYPMETVFFAFNGKRTKSVVMMIESGINAQADFLNNPGFAWR